ncbi:NBR1-Ig-like domain-containing protein [Micromonospora sp. NPDC047740]|uniref:NBR1-Ig-like domain-containing protein n=1 Tax=Micromonospora sp. NPDC047740 TaxID=3364254 RepID=UPI00371F4D68
MGAFADRLLRLKQEAGNPSYEEMSVRLGAAASRSSLAAAARGRRLPSWEMTWEFVRVLAVDRLGHDPVDTEQEWRERWMQAKAAGHSAGTASTAGAVPERPAASEAPPAVQETPQPETSEVEETERTGETDRTGDNAERGRGRAAPAAVEPSPPRLRARRHIGIAGVAATMAALTGAGVTFVVLDRRRVESDGSVTRAVVAPPDHDDSRFEGDITYPDGTLVPPNTSFTKIWRIRNTGTVVWANRSLARVNETPCQAPVAVAIPQTMPGETVDIAVSVRTPGEPGSCKIYWKMADEDGRMYFPLKRPVFLDVRVGGS